MSAVGSVTSALNSTSSASSGDQQMIAGNFQLFLQLLTTQLKNQDPTSPLDTNQFTQQLVQFASVEQQLKTNTNLDALVALNKSQQATASLNFVGAKVIADGSASEYKDGVAVWNVTSPVAATATVSVLDANGNTVWTDKQTLQQGIQSYAWNGRTSTGQLAPEGSYTIKIDAQDSEGMPVTTSTDFSGTVTGVDLSGSEPLLLVGSTYLKVNQIKGIVQQTTTPSS
ncbi:MAG TPA: flagellar hook capping FlgD N-terminal domain-containing protein [Xanthobacteraceae bacterium]|jgi:flagellar basal-body rod modification protein FlgD|nr:flagellar hook capping FlgD N-terminal domain-containing protein [Xanthobacteraceae bacterium]